MSVLAGLKLVAAKQQRITDPVQLRRNKLLTKLDEQIALVKAKSEGRDYLPTRSKRVKDDAGNISVVQQPKRVKAWFWAVEGGRVCVALRYGNKVIELGKGKTAVEVAAGEVGAVLATLRKAAEFGELDAQIDAVSAGTRAARR